MKSFIKFNNFIVLTTILLIFSISNAQMNSVTGVPDISKDPFLNNALSIDNWLPGGKNDDFSGSRGNVSYQREAYSIMPLSNMKMGVFSVQNAVVGAQHYYEKSFSNHPHWSHSPFDEVTSNSSSEKQYGTGSQTGYDISWTNTMIHPANGYDGMQGGGYPEPVGAYDTYSVNLSGMAVATYFVPEFDRSEYNPNWTDRNPLEHWNNAAIAAHDKLEKVLNDEDRNIFGKGIGVIASLIDGATSPLQGVVGIGSPELGAGYGQSSKVASEMFVSNFQNMSVSGQFEAIKIGDVLSCDTCGDVISVGGTLLAANQIKSVGKAKGNVPDVKNGINSVIEPKISKQMTKRGWDEKSINNLINDPKSKKVSTTDTRFDPSTNSRLNDPATAYIDSNGAYVVRNDKTGAIVQVSNKNDPNWVSPF
ncbi:MafB family polymorphic toxin [Wohlfahrtiimonas chitiniclastica]|uniref:MafB family polymorphic toxin n=1 Tax=Wohlfahrtiimonas chitiniclastica TaxID=400946 RepID=UPI001FEF9AEC|nr:MafB family polymorphic toxin [Wohlfahrtiimonas chitiniclastica]